MADYAIYKYDLVRPEQMNLNFTENIMQQNYVHRRVHFGNLFHKGTKMNLYQLKARLDNDIFDNYVLQVSNDVYVVQINKNEYKTLIEPSQHTVNGAPAFEARKAKSQPLGHVVIDNREGHGFMAIEKGTAWGKVPKQLCEVLQESLSRLLYDSCGLGIKICPKLQPTDFADFVDLQCRKHKDIVKRITIDYTGNAKRNGKNISGRGTRSLKALSDFSDKYNAIKSTFSMEFQEMNKEKIRDMVKLAQLCGEYDYNISVRFNDFGIYHNNDTIVAFYFLPDDILTDFINMQSSSDGLNGDCTYALLEWLDTSWQKTKELDDETTTP